MATRATSVQITMPQMGESVTEGTVLGWLKQVGDRVEADEPLVEISTDKVDAEVPAPVSGTLVNIAAEADETVQVGSVLGEIEPDGDGAAPAAPDEAPAARPRRRDGRCRIPGDGRLGGGGHRPRVAREARRRGRRRRSAGRDLHRQGRRRGAVARGGHDRGDPRPGRRDSAGRIGAVSDCGRGGRRRTARFSRAPSPPRRSPPPARRPPTAGTRPPWPRASRALTASTSRRSRDPARAAGSRRRTCSPPSRGTAAQPPRRRPAPTSSPSAAPRPRS